jgi:SAM-dependent methyltransferase
MVAPAAGPAGNLLHFFRFVPTATVDPWSPAMTEKKGSSWQDPQVARQFVEERRAAIPFGPEQVRVMFRLVHHFRPEPHHILDLGCGDGFLARALLAEFPKARAVLIDHSEPMLARAREAMAPVADRCEIVHGDLRDPLSRHAGRTPADLVVSGFAIHHLPHPRKLSLYEEIFDFLAPGGLFVNIEHVASASPEGEALFDTCFIDHIASLTSENRAQVEEKYHSRPDKADNILERVETQVDWLRKIGFLHADCYFKWLELAIFGGVKP